MRLKIALGVFVSVVVVVAAFALFVPRASRDESPVSLTNEVTPTPTVVIADTYKKGVHSISGSILASTPCTSVSAKARVASGTPETITIDLLMPPDTEVCLLEETHIPFEIEVEATENALIEAYVNGARASTSQALP